MVRGGTSRRLRRLLDASRGRKHGLIVIYRNPDPDALASAWALQRVLSKWRTPTVIAYTGELGRLENQAMVDYLGIPAGRLEPAAAQRADLVGVVDAQPVVLPGGGAPPVRHRD